MEEIGLENMFGCFYLDKEKDIRVDLFLTGKEMRYILRTPNHRTGNLISNLAKLCDLPISFDEQRLKIIEGTVPCYIDGYNHSIYIFRLGNTKVANIYPDGTIEMKAGVPAISKTLMSQTKDYRLDIKRTITKTYIRSDLKFHTDLHTHMNANLKPDILIALGIMHQIRYPLYYIKKLGLRYSARQAEMLDRQRREVQKRFADSPLTGKYLTRKIDDNTFINFADLILGHPVDAAYNIARIRTSLSILKDGQAVFTNLEKVYLYRYVFTKGIESEEKIPLYNALNIPDRGITGYVNQYAAGTIPDEDIEGYIKQMLMDRANPEYRNNSLFQDKLLWIARSAQAVGVQYLEISDTTLVKNPQAAAMLAEAHQILPAIYRETGVVIRFLAAIRRIALTLVKDSVTAGDYFRENLQVLEAVAGDPYVAGADIVGEEINDIRELHDVIRGIVRIAASDRSFVVRIHAGENDSLRDNVANSINCVKKALKDGQEMPRMRIGHGLYTANLNSRKGEALLRDLRDYQVVLEFQITSNVRLNNLNMLADHPLRSYLKAGVRCVQGTDGGALYGTDLIDEQLSLEKLLDLTPEEMQGMRSCEQEVYEASMQGFCEKTKAFAALHQKEISCAENGTVIPPGYEIIKDYYLKRIEECLQKDKGQKRRSVKLDSAESLTGRIQELPVEGIPVVVVGGSFNNDKHVTVVREYGCRLIDAILGMADPEKVFFVIGHRLKGYEKYLVTENRERYGGKFRIFAMVPTMILPGEAEELLESGVWIRVSVESSPMGLYKSFAYEIFKRRPSVLLALDGNSAGANMVQEARNARYDCRTYLNVHSRILKAKAESLEGYVTVFSDETKIIPMIQKDLSRWD